MAEAVLKKMNKVEGLRLSYNIQVWDFDIKARGEQSRVQKDTHTYGQFSFNRSVKTVQLGSVIFTTDGGETIGNLYINEWILSLISNHTQ